MNHPYELLADLMDGTLDEGDRAGVQAHLDVCPSCREDVALAPAGRRAARSLPQANAPADLHQRIIAAAGGRGRGAPGWYRWAGAAAAAAVVVAIAISLPNVGDAGDQRAGGEDAMVSAEVSGGAEDGAAALGNVAMSVENTNYDEEALKRLASGARSNTLSAGGEAAPTGTIADAPGAVRCVEQAFQNRITGRLTRLIQARFEGRAAYIAVYLESPGAGQGPDLAAVWVASRDDCSYLSLAFSRI
jgi:Putative zinc-finger